MLKLAHGSLAQDNFCYVLCQHGISGLNPYNGPPV
ncbi:hypothetical protein AP060_03067 [Pseudomonas sp. TAD18]|nr:hypothetical protein AP060_03067 [Pseudomonas sp. TAD18]KVV04997.1 hypothetical protein AP059_03050 [Pseudomonas sp. TAA207]